ncbi:MAG: cold shock domain-containing protein [Alistipes sp.]|nr:cold shock domain-containing protein [Alistipes sp.]
MAKPQSFNKRENEKKKAAKRLEKQKRKEERKSTGSGSMDDMIAWVDEHGMIVDTPPEEREKEEISLDDILISTPKKEEAVYEKPKGRVEYFNESKGYGFIKDVATAEKYFFHISSAPAGIAEGNTVWFDTERGARGMSAVNISMSAPEKADPPKSE